MIIDDPNLPEDPEGGHAKVGGKLSAFVVLLLFLIALVALFPAKAHAQDLLEVDVGVDSFARPIPTTLEESNKVLVGMTNLLNDVIAVYMKDSEDAQAKVENILVAATQTDKSLSQLAKDRVAVVPAKSWLVGGFFRVNPIPSVGGGKVVFGPGIGYNLFNQFLVQADVGVEISQQTSLMAGVSVEYWLF
jgi:hypothetical protein